MDPKSGDPTLGQCVVDDPVLDEFLKDVINNDDQCEFLFDGFDGATFLDEAPILPIEYAQSDDSPDEGTGSLSPKSSFSMSPHSQYSPESPKMEIKSQPTAVTIVTKNSLSSKRRISDRVKKPSAKAQKKPRIEKAELIPKLEVLDDLPAAIIVPKSQMPTSDSQHQAAPLVTSGGEFDLTTEERDVLAQNNWDATEKNLKKARRKIKNKISAQESRRRKRDYVSNLEERLSNYSQENSQLKKELEKEQADKKSLLCQLRELQQVVNQRFQGKNVKTATTQTSAAVMVVLLCMTIFKGSWNSTQEEEELKSIDEVFDYSTPSYKSRVLKCFSEDDMDFCNVDGKNLPLIRFDGDQTDETDPVGILRSEMAKLNVAAKREEYQPGTLVNIAHSVMNNHSQPMADKASRSRDPTIGIPNLTS